jgi:hypothetical protein
MIQAGEDKEVLKRLFFKNVLHISAYTVTVRYVFVKVAYSVKAYALITVTNTNIKALV